ncbi:hypothetical protein ACLK1S_23375 [Escherichia coli]
MLGGQWIISDFDYRFADAEKH